MRDPRVITIFCLNIARPGLASVESACERWMILLVNAGLGEVS